MDINPSLQICGWNVNRIGGGYGIRQKSTKEWTHSLTAVPFVRGHRSVFPRTSRNSCVYTRHPMFVTATSGMLTWLLAKLSKNRMRVQTSADRRVENKIAGLNGLRSEGVKWVYRILNTLYGPFSYLLVVWAQLVNSISYPQQPEFVWILQPTSILG